jgi:hypothetical protein
VAHARFKDDASRGAENWVALRDQLAPKKPERLASSLAGRLALERVMAEIGIAASCTPRTPCRRRKS